jgi:hypothetical protein
MLPPGNDVVVIASWASMAMLRAAVAVALGVAESWTWTVKLDVPVAVGVPEMTPVAVFKVKPAGSAPEMMLQV